MIFDVLQKLGIKAGEDYIKGERESAPDLNNPEEVNQLLMDLITGTAGGIGGTVKSGGNLMNKILTKIKARNARGIRNLRQGQGTGAQSMSSSNREFLNKEWDVWRKLKDLVK